MHLKSQLEESALVLLPIVYREREREDYVGLAQARALESPAHSSPMRRCSDKNAEAKCRVCIIGQC